MNFILSDKISEKEIIEEAAQYIAGGVVSLNRKVDPHIVFKRAAGSKLYDWEGKEYIDFHAAFAPFILGHNNKQVNEAVKKSIEDESSLFGTGTTFWEAALAKIIVEGIPSVELVQMTNTGSEATAHAIRVSRAYTGKDHIVLMLGGYNGWHNDVARVVTPSLKQIGPRKKQGEYTFLPSSAGIPAATTQNIHLINFNDLASLEYILKKYPVACVMTEPVLQNIGVVKPKAGYLEGMIRLCKQYEAVCIFDEVKTGFRTSFGGYQQVAGLHPDISVFGKAVANGYPLGVIGGKREIMELFDAPDPIKRVLIAGTYNAHPMSIAASIATLRILKNEKVYPYLDSLTEQLVSGLTSIFKEKGMRSVIVRNASAFCFYFMEKEPADWHDILENHDFKTDIRLRKKWIERGIYQIPIACKQASVSFAHSQADIDKTLQITWEIIKDF